jgi:RHS repeat-associated protein
MVGSGGRYDANGNFYSGNWSYDVENRLVSDDAGGGEQYVYDASNKRVYRQNDSRQINGGGEWYYFYGLDGKVMGEYSVGWGTTQNVYGPMSLNRVTEWAYFGGKTVVPGVAHDRLGSPRGNASAAYYPYGENYVSPGPSEEGFTGWVGGTQAGLSYADQRYYSSQYGRFNTPDRYKASAGPADPGSWNRYAYVGNDPANFGDPTGEERNSIDIEYYLGGALVCTYYADGDSEAWNLYDCDLTSMPPGLPVGQYTSSVRQAFLNHWVGYNKKYAARLGSTINNLSTPCQQAFSQGGISLSSLSEGAGDITFWDTAGAVESNLTVGQVAGASARYGGSLLGSVNSVNGAAPIATVLQTATNLPGVFTNTLNVVLNAGFFGESVTDQNSTLLHEAMHAILDLTDAQIATALGVNWSKSGDPASAITPFLSSNCDKSKSY